MAGLPNITGGFNGFGDEGTRGAFISKRESDTAYRVSGGSAQWKNDVTFNASLSNTTYGSSTTVTPLSESCLFYIRY